MYDIYYAHHQWKYGTKIEEYELRLIRRYFYSGTIFNPATDLESTIEDGEIAIMEECFAAIDKSDILVFSSMDGIVGTGVYHEVKEAQRLGKLVLYIYQDELHSNFNLDILDTNNHSDRLYGRVDIL